MDVFDLKGILTLDSSKFESGLNNAKSMASGFGSGLVNGFKKVAGMTTAALAATTAAATGFAKSAVQTGMAFDAMMGQVGATMGKDAEDMEQEIGSVETSFGHFEGTLREFALFMGQNTKFSASEAASALNYMALAGYETEQSMQMLPAVLSMAAAGAMDLGRASDMITDTQAALGLTFERTNQMVDEFAKAASSGNTTVEMLGEAFLRVGGLAKELNGGFVQLSDGTWAEVDGVQELEIAFTAMANAGVKGSEAGTHMRNMLLKLSNPTDKGAEAFERLGVSVFDAEGQMRSLSDIFFDMEQGLSKVTQAEKLAAIGEIFNARDTASAEALLGAIEGTVQYEGEIYAISTAYEKWGDAIYDVNQGFIVSQASWDRLGEAILDSEGAAAAMSSRQLNNLSGSITLFKSALETAKITLSDQLTPALRQFVEFGTEGLQKIVNGFNENGITGAMDAFGEILSDGVNMVIESLPKAIGAGSRILGAIAQGIMDNMDAVTDAASQVLTMIAELTIKGMPGLLKIGGEVLSKVGAWIIGNADTILDGVEGIILQVADFVGDNIGPFFDGFLSLMGKIATRLPKIITPLLKKIPQAIKDVSSAVVKNAPTLIKGATDVVIAVAQDLPEILAALIAEAPNVIIALVKGLNDNLPLLVTKLIESVGMLIGKIPEIIAGLIGAIPDMIDMFFDKENGFLSVDNIAKFIQGGKDLVVALVTAIPEIIKYLLTDGIPSIISSVLGAFGLDVTTPGGFGYELVSGIRAVLTEAYNVAKEIFDWFGLLMNDPAAAIQKAFDGIAEYAKKTFWSVYDIVSGIVELVSAWDEEQARKVRDAKLAAQKAMLESQGWHFVTLSNGSTEIMDSEGYANYIKEHHGNFPHMDRPDAESESGSGNGKAGGGRSFTGVDKTGGGRSFGVGAAEKEPVKVEETIVHTGTIELHGDGMTSETFEKTYDLVTTKVQTDIRLGKE